MTNHSHLISVAPMMDWTDRHYRYFLRLIAPNVRLYTEMITSHALIHGDAAYLLAFNDIEHPVALQLGGSDPAMLRTCAKMGEAYGYDEINLNVGCPSPRVNSGQFGACLMLKPALVAECVAAMQAAVSIPVTVKCRIGVDDQDSYAQLQQFIQVVASAGCNTFILHARKAWLSGLSPKQNREIPPLKYEIVRQVKQDFPHLTIIGNGGIKTLAAAEEHLSTLNGVMIGRAAYTNPYLLAELQARYYEHKPILTRHEVIEQFIPYVHAQLNNNVRLVSITRHILGLFQGVRGAAAWRRYLSENTCQPHANADIIREALALVHH